MPGRLAGLVLQRVAGLAACVLVAPLGAGVALAVRAGLGRPVLFRQERAGLGGRPFRILKFRTMRPPATPGEPDAARLTRLGRLLRATSLDELPSLWNVVRGEMAFVGPRPLPVAYTTRYSDEQARRLWVRPGITGPVQTRGRNAMTWDDKFALDTWYVDNRSWRLDLRILAATPLAVLGGRGVAHEGHATMPEFVGSRSPGS
jgi:sugar transferase EpsL